MRTASNSPLTQKYGDKTTHVSITVLLVLKLIASPVLTQFCTGPKKCRFSIPIGKIAFRGGPLDRGAPRNCVVPKHATVERFFGEPQNGSGGLVQKTVQVNTSKLSQDGDI